MFILCIFVVNKIKRTMDNISGTGAWIVEDKPKLKVVGNISDTESTQIRQVVELPQINSVNLKNMITEYSEIYNVSKNKEVGDVLTHLQMAYRILSNIN